MELKLDQIMDMDVYKNHVGLGKELARKAWYNVGKNNNVRLIRYGDSVLAVDVEGPHKGEFHFINAAKFEDFIENVKKCLDDVKNTTNLETIYTYFTNERICDVAAATGYTYSVENRTDNEPGYKMTVRL